MEVKHGQEPSEDVNEPQLNQSGLDHSGPNELESNRTSSNRSGSNNSQHELAGQPATTFADLDLSDIMLAALKRMGFEKPSPIQAALIPPALEGYDVIGQARTGTGKTASFAIPILEQLDPMRLNPNPQALVLVPTRELAHQVHGEFIKLAHGCETSVIELSGGKHMEKQIKGLRAGCQIVVGTPGRVIDHIQKGTLKLSNVWSVVLDEADRMLDIGFRPDIERILRRCPEQRQTLLLSATLARDVLEIANRYLYEPKQIDCSKNDLSVDTIEQRYFLTNRYDKFDLLVKLLSREHPPQAIIFCRTKLGTAKLHRQLENAFADDPVLRAMRLDTIHGNMNQPQRDKVFERLRTGNIQLLVATDVVGRGIDVSTISHIINYDLPQDCDDYVHRVGRTGRMGRDGIAYSFVTKDEGSQLTDIELRINRLLMRDSFDSELNDSLEHRDDSMPVESEKGRRIHTTQPKTVDENAFNLDAVESPNRGASGSKRRLSPMKKKISERLSRSPK